MHGSSDIQPAVPAKPNHILASENEIITRVDLVAYGPDPAANPTVAERDRKNLFTCSDRSILAVWPVLLKEQEFVDRNVFYDGPHDCKELFEIRLIDLNNDGVKEILLRGRTVPLCGGVGNCLFWVFGKALKGYKTLLATSDYVDRSHMGRQVQKKFTNGYRDILVTGHFTAGETSFAFMKFNGRRYRESKCFYEVFDKEVNGKPTWKFVPCEKFVSRLEN